MSGTRPMSTAGLRCLDMINARLGDKTNVRKPLEAITVILIIRVAANVKANIVGANSSGHGEKRPKVELATDPSGKSSSCGFWSD